MEEIVTGEAVVLDLPFARFPTRLLARLIDLLVETVILVVIIIVMVVGALTKVLNDASEAAVFIAGFVLVLVGYPITCETLSRGRSPGKMALGLRVVADDGGPERFRQALVRALAGFVECWMLLGVPALVTAMLSARGKRLGDVFAGTFVVRERAPKAAAPYSVLAGTSPAAHIHPALQAWAAALDLSAIPDQLAASAASYLGRFWQLNETARQQLGTQLASDVAARVAPPPPPGLSPADYLHAVITERRRRELARLQPSPAGPGPGYWVPPSPGPTFPGQPYSGPPYSGPPYSGPPYPGQPSPGQPAPAPPAAGQPFPSPGTGFTPPA